MIIHSVSLRSFGETCLDLKIHFSLALKRIHNVALSTEDNAQGKYQRIDQLEVLVGNIQIISLEGVLFPINLIREVFTNHEGSTAVPYLVTSDLALDADPIIPICQKRWKVEEYHRSLKQNATLAKSPTRTETTHQAFCGCTLGVCQD